MPPVIMIHGVKCQRSIIFTCAKSHHKPRRRSEKQVWCEHPNTLHVASGEVKCTSLTICRQGNFFCGFTDNLYAMDEWCRHSTAETILFILARGTVQMPPSNLVRSQFTDYFVLHVTLCYKKESG